MDVCAQGKSTKRMPGKNDKTIKKDVKESRVDLLKFKNEPEKLKKNRKKLKKGRGMIYIGRIPHGFYEDQMSAYFKQFGRVLSAVVSRSKTTGRSKGYGFVEFEDEEVAKIAAETMNNYLMYNKILKCRYIPPEERKSVFKRKASTLICPRVLNRIESTKNKRNYLSKLNLNTYQKKTQQKIAEFEQFFKERGFIFNFKADVGSSKEKENSDSEKDDAKDLNDTDSDVKEQFGVLEIDPSDTEIHFNTPPNVKKVIKKSTNPSVAQHDKSQIGTESKMKRAKKSSLKEAKEIIKAKEGTKRIKRKVVEKNQVGKKMTKKVLKTKKSKSLKEKDKKRVRNQKKLRTKEVAKARINQKEKSNTVQKSPQNIHMKSSSSKMLSEIPPQKKIKSVNISIVQY